MKYIYLNIVNFFYRERKIIHVYPIDLCVVNLWKAEEQD